MTGGSYMKLPQEFSERMKILLGKEYEEFLKTYEEPRRYGLRVNTLKISAQEFEKIAPFPIERLPWIPGGYWYEKCGTEPDEGMTGKHAGPSKEEGRMAEPSRHPFYYAGLYYLQEPSAMTPASVLPVEPGDRVLDLCAAPGGKATALAAKLKGKGLLVANDISASRAKALLKNLEVFGVTNAFVTNTVPAKLAGQFPLFFDKILVDAPCSGEGMFRKDAANARAWSPEKVEDCAKIQKGILCAAVAMLRPGGLLLYSTCTFAPEEDEQAAAYLLKKFPEMELCDIPWYEGFSHGRPELGRESWQEYAKADRQEPESGRNNAADAAGNIYFREQGRHQENCEIREKENFQDEQNFRISDDRILAQLSKCVRIFPHKMRGEGHFLALFRKREQREILFENAERSPHRFLYDISAYEDPFERTETDRAENCEDAADRKEKGDRAGNGRDRAADGKEKGDRAGNGRDEAADRKEKGDRAGNRRGRATDGKEKGGRAGNGRGRAADRKKTVRDSHDRRENGRKQTGNSGSVRKDPSRAEWEILQEFLQDVKMDFQKEQIEVRNNQVYLVPEALSVVQGIPFLRNGLYMGEIRRDRFEPSQSFAMALGKECYASVVALSPDDERTYRYLKGETIEVDDIMPVRAGGWQLVCVDGYPLGWGKLTNGMLKNKYHSGWRM